MGAFLIQVRLYYIILNILQKPQVQRESTNKASKFQKLASNIKKEGRFCGSFDDRQHQSLLPWKQRVMEYETYTIPDDCHVTWVEVRAFPNAAPSSTIINRWRSLISSQVECLVPLHKHFLLSFQRPLHWFFQTLSIRFPQWSSVIKYGCQQPSSESTGLSFQNMHRIFS